MSERDREARLFAPPSPFFLNTKEKLATLLLLNIYFHITVRFQFQELPPSRDIIFFLFHSFPAPVEDR